MCLTWRSVVASLLLIPPDQAYGKQGAGKLGSDETLIFVIDLIKVLGGNHTGQVLRPVATA